jgi:hypothetical protein
MLFVSTIVSKLSPPFLGHLSVTFTFRLPLRLSSGTTVHLCPSSRKQTDLVRQNASCRRIALRDFHRFHVTSYHVTSNVQETESIFVLVLRFLWIMSWHFEWWAEFPLRFIGGHLSSLSSIFCKEKLKFPFRLSNFVFPSFALFFRYKRNFCASFYSF